MTEINFLLNFFEFFLYSQQSVSIVKWLSQENLPPSKANAIKFELHCETTLISTSDTTLHDPVQFHLDFFQQLNEQ